MVLLGDNHPELSGIAWKLNCLLGSMGTCIQLLKAPRPTPYGTLDDLVRDIRGKKVEIVFLLDAGNPVLDSGHSSGLSEALNRVESIHLGMYEDETSRVCRWHLPAAHFLESWGVERDYRGRFCYRQPVILPLYGGISPEEVLSGLLSSKGHLSTADNSPTHLSPVYHRARKCFERAVNPENKTAAWAQALQRGYSEETAYAPLSPQEETALGTAMMQTPGSAFWPPREKIGNRDAGIAIPRGLFHWGRTLETQCMDAGMPGPNNRRQLGGVRTGLPRHLSAAGRFGFRAHALHAYHPLHANGSHPVPHSGSGG